MLDSQTNIEQNLIDAGCDKEFIAKFIRLSKEQKAEMLKMLAAHRKTLLDGIHKDERKVYCLDYLVNRLNKK